MKIGIIIQARMTSTRLPGKVMMDICGQPVLGHLIERIKDSKYSPCIIVATTQNKQDNRLENFAKSVGVEVFRGSECNVLERYYLAAQAYNLDIIVRITSDCPLYEVRVLDEMIDEFFTLDNIDYLSNVKERTYPRGLDTEIFTFSTLEKVYAEAIEDTCKEHVTPYIYQNPQIFKIADYKYEKDLSQFRWTLDTGEDYILIKKIYEELYYKNKKFHMEDILEMYQSHPEWLFINHEIEQKKVGYKGV